MVSPIFDSQCLVHYHQESHNVLCSLVLGIVKCRKEISKGGGDVASPCEQKVAPDWEIECGLKEEKCIMHCVEHCSLWCRIMYNDPG